MQSFANDLNSGNRDLGDYTHSDATNHYLALTALFWNSNFEGDGSFTFAMDGNTATATEAGNNFVFTLEKDGTTYAIRTIIRNGITIFE